MSKKSFSNYALSKEVRRALTGLGYEHPTEVQGEVIPVALQKKDLVVKSQTGSGKTASFGIPLCEMVEWEENKPQALVLTPTRELAVQVKEDITNIGRFKRIKAAAIYGKSPFARQKLELKQKTHIVVGTPGRVLDHIEKGTLSLERLKYLVIDEADEMLNMGFIDQVEAIIDELPTKRMTMLFSATLPEDVEKLSRTYMNAPTHIEIKAAGITTEKIEHTLFEVREEEKLSLLKDVTMIENPDSCIIFCRTQENVDHVYRQLKRVNYPCDKIHGGMVQEDRFEVMDDFRKGKFRYLVATDVAARGIDIDNITHVINYDIPLEKESYVHRTGRTGRAGNSGKAITFITPYENRFLEEIEEYIGFEIPKELGPSKEEVMKGKAVFEEKIYAKPIIKKDKNADLNKGIMKLYFNGGKKKKIRAVDFVGTIAKIQGVSADDIGIITIQDNVSYVEILNGKGPLVLKVMRNTTIKGKQLKVHEAIK
ncbi:MULTISPECIES: ATP-dependent RNA helicase DbpA [Bacillus cereus group]|uniref:ATP-dependent RNA helicase DbpA n=1 Tax=Bacillus mobilis TaxID=2026190 RepID=A0A1Y5Z0Y5_9BACI|nr:MULTISPECIES: ATP-dependent RNA helicase DbpA [Bacillus cereus group]MDG1619853.1 ATP-dependent RNA helicase DbpA [Bacillus mobilis]MDX5837734.1 ATP-dependent RNA helicase DbpA [Bacillus cereus group sp. BfR-BA-01700]OJE34678.1 RNA helicase [Bacillus mobilis]SMD70623.1 ATP-dependent RNA helicase DbpA [Bacillus mobilis]HDR7241137.1 ATP-dependent RNA helicase DbpA [Bacillus mobilis]